MKQPRDSTNSCLTSQLCYQYNDNKQGFWTIKLMIRASTIILFDYSFLKGLRSGRSCLFWLFDF